MNKEIKERIFANLKRIEKTNEHINKKLIDEINHLRFLLS